MSWQDAYTIKALREGYRARSVFKLRELNNKFNLIKEGDNVVDLGCFPGSWLKWCSEQVGKTGFVLGIDIKPTHEIHYTNIKILKADIFKVTKEEILSEIKKVDVVCSDMAPSTSGVKHLDRSICHALALRALELAAQLIQKGNCTIKYFQSSDDVELLKVARKYLAEVRSKLAEGINEASLEERYQEAIKKGKRLEFHFWFWTCFIILATGFFGYLAYTISPKLIPVPIFVGIIIYIIQLIFGYTKSKNLLNQNDRELINLMKERGRLL